MVQVLRSFCVKPDQSIGKETVPPERSGLGNLFFDFFHFALHSVEFHDIYICMEYKRHINIRISENQLKRLMSAMLREKVTLSTLVRNILHSYIVANSTSTDNRATQKKKK